MLEEALRKDTNKGYKEDYKVRRESWLIFAGLLLHPGLDAPGQLAALYKYASDNGYTIRAVGTGSSWSRLTHTKDILLDMTGLKEFVTLAPWSRLDNKGKENVDIEVQAGMRVIDFVEKLDTDYGLALDMMGNYAGQTVAGVANTSTHGSGLFSGTMVRNIYETNSSTLNGNYMISLASCKVCRKNCAVVNNIPNESLTGDLGSGIAVLAM